MNMPKINSHNKNVGGTQINGNNNNILLGNPNIDAVFPTETETYSLLQIVNNSNLPEANIFALNDPDKMEHKLKYNDAYIYKDYSEDYIEGLLRIGKAMEDFENSEAIVLKLRQLFLKNAARNNMKNIVPKNGDDILDKIHFELRKTILSDERYDKHMYTIEKLDNFIIALLLYGIFKCKILVNPLEDNSN